MKILLRLPNWIGDATNSIPVILNLKRAGHTVVGICHKRVAPVFENLIPCHTFLTRKRMKILSFKNRGKFDVGIVFPVSFSSAFGMWIAHPKIRIGFDGEHRSIFLTHVINKKDFWRKEHIVESYLRLLTPLGIQPEKLEPQIELRNCEKTLKKFKLTDRKYVTVGPFANYGPAKEWPLQNFFEIMKTVKSHGYDVILLGSYNDTFKVKKVKDIERSGFINLVGKTTLKETMCILASSVALLSIDSGLSHLGVACGTEVLTLFLSTDPNWTAPYGKRGHYIYHKLPCSPCFKRTCPLGTYECYNSITTDEVLSLLMNIIEKNS